MPDSFSGRKIVMDKEAMEKRKRIMGRSIKLGHCVCDPAKSCPCQLFKDKNICECAGEKAEIAGGEIRLTEYVRAVGCASKVPKKYLHDVLGGLHGFSDSRVLVGSEKSDDAGVIELAGNERVSIMTVDVFAPSVDDPYTFGMIAAANSLSDIYAMGGKPECALSIIGFPIYLLPESAMREMLQGGADKLAEAGVAVIGGHSINDSEVKCGYVILGSLEKEKIKTNDGAKVGDVLVLTKPVGGGIILFGNQLAKVREEELAEVTAAMTTLNKLAGMALPEYHASAATDVTGFSLLGHLAEMAAGSNIEAELDFAEVPLFSGVERLAKEDVFPGAVERNREAAGAEIIDYGDLSEIEQNILYSPETSGGLLVSLAEPDAAEYMKYLADNGIAAAVIGKITTEYEGGHIVIKGGRGLEKKEPERFLAEVRKSQPCVSDKNSPDGGCSCCCSK